MKNTFLGALMLGLALAGCGSSSDSKSDAGNSGAGTTGGTSAGTGGTAGGTNTGMAGSGGTGTDGGMPQLTCDKTITSVAMCGTNTCTAPTSTESSFCQVTCCTSDNKCGTKNTSDRAMGTTAADCALPAVADHRCDSVVPATLKNFGSSGCCMANGNCGALAVGMCLDPAVIAQGFGGGKDAGTVAPVKCTDAENDAGN